MEEKQKGRRKRIEGFVTFAFVCKQIRACEKGLISIRNFKRNGSKDIYLISVKKVCQIKTNNLFLKLT